VSTVDDLARRIVALERALATQGSSAQLAYSSVEDGAVPVYDGDGRLRSQVGRQFDGTFTGTDFNGAPPPATTGPYVEGVLGGLRVLWDGKFQSDALTPMDFRRVEVHVSTAAGFVPDSTTLKATFESPRGAEVLVKAGYGVEHYVVLVARNTSGVAGPASAEGLGTPVRVASGDIATGAVQVDNLAFPAGVSTFVGSTAPTASMTGDLWLKTPEKLLHRWDGAAWVQIDDARIAQAIADAAAAQTDASQALANAATAQATADGKVTTFLQPTAPVAEGVGDLWIDTDAGNHTYIWDGLAWVDAQDQGIGQAITNAATAQATADNKIVSFWQAEPPAAGAVGDLWYDTDAGNRPHWWDGAAWRALPVGDAALTQSVAGSIGQKLYDTMDDASLWQVVVGPVPTTVATTEARTGGFLMRGDGLGSKWYARKGLVPFDPDVLYRITARFRVTRNSANGLGGKYYAGLAGVGADGVTLVNRNGLATYDAQHYLAARALTVMVADGWVTVTGYARGHAQPAVAGSSGPRPSPSAPGQMHADVRYVRPVVVGDFDGGDGAAEWDLVTVEVVEVGAVTTGHFAPGVNVPGTVESQNAARLTNGGLILPVGTSLGYDDAGNPSSQIAWERPGSNDVPAAYIEARDDGRLVIYNATNVYGQRTVTEISGDDLDVVTGAAYFHRIQDDKTKFDGPGVYHFNGRVEARQPALGLYASAQQSIADRTDTVVGLTDVQCDTGDLKYAANEVTIPRDGTYTVTAGLAWASNNTGTRAFWVQSVNFGRLPGDEKGANPVSRHVCNTSWSGHLKAGDKLRIMAYQSSGASLSTDLVFWKPFLAVTYHGWSTGVAYAPPPEPTTSSRTDTFYPVQSASWRTTYGGWRTDNDHVYQGNGSAFGGSGTHSGLYFFDHAKIRTALAGRSIDTVEVWSYRDTGVGDGAARTIHLHTHNHDRSIVGGAQPSYVSDFGDVTFDGKARVLAPGDGGWTLEHPNLGVQLRDNTAKGIGIFSGTADYLRLHGRSVNKQNGAVRIKSTG
jgi:hypothetical protein